MFRVTQVLQKQNRGLFLSYMFAYFSCIYHLVFLFVFRKLEVYPMFYFNFFSIAIFLTLCILIPLKKTYKIPYSLGLIEVAVHQILADHYIGPDTHFHYLLLVAALLSILTYNDKNIIGILYTALGAIIFTCEELITNYVSPVYTIPSSAAFIIKVANTCSGVILILSGVFVFKYLVTHIEENLALQVTEKTKELEEEINKVDFLQNHIIFSLASLVENRDSDTGAHVKRTSAYVGLLARKAREKGLYSKILTEDYIKVLERAAPMHDIGKIVVPDAVLKKRGRLTDEEFSLMKRHTLEGDAIVKEIVGISEDREYVTAACEIALNHHEKWNGKGYPNGKKGVQIPLCARIMALADVLDALIEKRCYKEPMPIDDAFNLIREEAGNHFDPQLAALFIELRSEIEEIHEKYIDESVVRFDILT